MSKTPRIELKGPEELNTEKEIFLFCVPGTVYELTKEEVDSIWSILKKYRLKEKVE